MRFRKNARLDPSQVEDRRGQGRVSLPGGGLAVGGGGLGLVALAIYLLVAVLSGGGDLSGPLQNLDNQTVANQPPSSAIGSDCQTGAAANAREDCRIVGVVNSVQAYWAGQFQRNGRTTRSPRPSSSPARPTPAAALRARTSAPSTARWTRRSTSTWGSSTTCAPASARPAARSRRPTFSPTNTATTSRTSKVSCQATAAARVPTASH
jgi:hypothetical protein